MSIPQTTPHYVKAKVRSDGLIDYVVMSPRGWGNDVVIYRPSCAAKDEQQIRGRVQHKMQARQETIEIYYVEELSER